MKEHPGIKLPWTHLDIFASTRRPASVIRTRTTPVCGGHALALRGCESGLDQFDHHVDREPVRTQDRLGVTVTAPCKQFERAAAVRIRPVRPEREAFGITNKKGGQDAFDCLWRRRYLQDSRVSSPHQPDPLAKSSIASFVSTRSG
jgi:hypothetical protein